MQNPIEWECVVVVRMDKMMCWCEFEKEQKKKPPRKEKVFFWVVIVVAKKRERSKHNDKLKIQFSLNKLYFYISNRRGDSKTVYVIPSQGSAQ